MKTSKDTTDHINSGITRIVPKQISTEATGFSNVPRKGQTQDSTEQKLGGGMKRSDKNSTTTEKAGKSLQRKNIAMQTTKKEIVRGSKGKGPKDNDIFSGGNSAEHNQRPKRGGAKSNNAHRSSNNVVGNNKGVSVEKARQGRKAAPKKF